MHNLPAQMSSFVGRRREQYELERLLATERLLTLVGPGGSGKTRLALQTGAAVGGIYPDGIWLVDLSTVSAQESVAAAIAAAVGLAEEAARPVEAALANFVKSRRMLLVLDTCEHLISTVATVAQDLLVHAPGLQILATSREPLGLVGEFVWRLPPLPVPDMHEPLLPVPLLECDSVRLFAERAAAAKPGFAVSDRNAAAVAQICTQLDGLPLAIEHAAAWVRAMTASEIAERLDKPGFPSSLGCRTTVVRHQTLRSSIDWSYGLLTEPERRVWQRLSPFRSGLTPEEAQELCAYDGVSVHQVPDLLLQLVDKSILYTSEAAGETRFHMLETHRRYGLARLETAREPESALVPAGLTQREAEVVQLLAAGMSDREIAHQLVISRFTVASHLRNVFSKLGLPSRSKVAAWAFQQGIGRPIDYGSSSR